MLGLRGGVRRRAAVDSLGLLLAEVDVTIRSLLTESPRTVRALDIV